MIKVSALESPTVVRPQARPVTLEALLALPETKPASEFINGKITSKPMPKGKHSRLQTKLSNLKAFELTVEILFGWLQV